MKLSSVPCRFPEGAAAGRAHVLLGGVAQFSGNAHEALRSGGGAHRPGASRRRGRGAGRPALSGTEKRAWGRRHGPPWDGHALPPGRVCLPRPGAAPRPAPRPSPLLPGADALSCQKDELVVTKPLLVSGSPVPWPRTRDAWPPSRASGPERVRPRVLSSASSAPCRPPCAQVPVCPQWPRPSPAGRTRSRAGQWREAPLCHLGLPGRGHRARFRHSPGLFWFTGAHALGRELAVAAPPPSAPDALGVATSPQAPLYCHQLPPGVARDCQGQLAPGCAPGLWPPAMALGVPQHVRTPRASVVPNAQSRLRAPVLWGAASLAPALHPLRRGGSEVADSSAGRAATAGLLALQKGSGRTRQQGGPGSSLWATRHPSCASVLPAKATVRASAAGT